MTVAGIRELSPEGLLEPSWLSDYEKQIDALRWQLVRLNSYVLVLEEVLSFPFGLFLPVPSDRHFWHLVEDSLFESSVLIIWRIGIDTGSDVATLSKLKNEMRRHLRDAVCQHKFDQMIEDSGVKEKLNSFRDRFKIVRDRYIAHLIPSAVEQDATVRREQALSFDELKRCRDILDEFFSLLCLGHGRSVLPWGYLGGEAPDIRNLLDRVAEHSPLLRMPEEQAKLWSAIRESLDESDIGELNRYRQRFGLARV